MPDTFSPASQAARADACTAPGKAAGDAKPARFKVPYFRVDATALVYFQETTSAHPDTRLRISFYISHRDDQFQSGQSAAKFALIRLGVNEDRIKTFEIEVVADEYIACDARYVRNPNHEPVQAFWNPEKKDEARLIKQRRLVPENQRHMVEIYGPKPAVTAELPEAVSA